MKSNYNFNTGKIATKVGEHNNKPGKTIPDQAMSIPELIRRYVNGQSLGGSKIPVFDENPEEDILQGRPFASYDLSEQHQIMENVKREYKDIIDRQRNNKKSKQPAIESTDKVDENAESKPLE